MITSGVAPTPEPRQGPTPSGQPGVNTAPPLAGIRKALGGGALDYKGNLAKVVHRYLLRSYDKADVEWVLDPHIEWEYEPSVKLADIDMARRPGGRDPGKVASIADSVDAGASMEPCVLVEFATPDPAGLNVADGFHRTLGAEHAGSDAVPAFIGRGVPDEFRADIVTTMAANSHGAAKGEDLKKAAEDLRRWRTKAIGALKKSGSADVSFESMTIPQAHASLIKAALATAKSPDDVWALFGGTR